MIDYLRHVRHKRNQCLKSIDASFKDVEESRLEESTFTRDEVQQILSGLCGVIKADVQSELIASAHTNALLLRQLFNEGEKWKMNLQVDISEMENRDLLEKIVRFEEKAFEKEANPMLTPKPSQLLVPLNTAGGDKLLQMEIQRLEEDKKKLAERVHMLEAKVTSTLKERDDLKAKAEIGASNKQDPSCSEQLEKQAEQRGILEDKLKLTTSDLQKVTLELQNTKEELGKSFGDSHQYQNMKKMLNTKNEQIKELRTKLKKYEGSGDGDDSS